ncbi:MAG: DUF4270 domain-containing protein [Balneolales bacterium]|nr:DUF4270 domain-containing protein [Balneolales bacterium]
MRRLKNYLPALGALLIALTVLTSCEESGIVGSSFVTTDPDIIIDTMQAGQIQTESLVTFSGSKVLVATGRFDDQLFGTYEATALLNPAMLASTIEIEDDAEFGLVLKRPSFTGDSTSVNRYQIYEITRRWRGNEWKADSVASLSLSPMLSFEITNEDSIFVPLPSDWTDRYKSYYELESDRVAQYNENMFGFAIVHESGNRIDYFNTNDSYLYIKNPDVQGEDPTVPQTTQIRQRATSYQLVEAPSTPMPADRIEVRNDFSTTGRLSFTINPDDFPQRTISRAEIVLHEDVDMLNSSLRPGEARSSNNIIRVFELEEDEKDFYITKDAVVNVQRSTDGRYRINLTTLFNNALREGGREVNLYFISDQDNGIIRPGLFFNENDSERFPQLIITKINPN